MQSSSINRRHVYTKQTASNTYLALRAHKINWCRSPLVTGSTSCKCRPMWISPMPISGMYLRQGNVYG